MDKHVRESVAALWEMMWTVPHSGMSADEQTARVMMTMGSMTAVLQAAGVTHGDIADWIRQDRVELPDLEGVNSKGEDNQERDEQLALAERVMFLHYRKLHEKEQKFLESVTEQIRDEGRYLSPKQKKWLFDLARKYGV